jgi:hypothetical protein
MITEHIIEAIETMPIEFTTSDIVSWCATYGHSRASIVERFSQIAGQGGTDRVPFKLIKRGSGRRPHLYEKMDLVIA